MTALHPSPTVSRNATEKLYYIDHIRVILTILVILHHACVMYGASGGWYYKEPTAIAGALIPLTVFVSTNQSFFMGFFFLLAAFFSYSSYQRKGAKKFLTDRLLRLGLPLLFYSFIFSPFVSFLIHRFVRGHHVSYLKYLSLYDDWIDFGVLWFVAALLIFTLVYIAYQKLFAKQISSQTAIPGPWAIILVALGTGLISFLVRILFPVGWVLKPLGFQPGHFTQYIMLFIIGLLAAKNNWLAQLSYRTGKRMRGTALILLLFFPVFYVIRVKFGFPITWYSGGFNGLSLLYSLWEQCIGFCIITAFLGIGKQRWNKTTVTSVFLSRRAFAVYILHPLALVALAIIFRSWNVDPAIKLLVVAPAAVFLSYLIATIVLWIPLVKRIV
ncbi:acyltransferase family protein [Mucilaginibacter sp. 44-25]|uniref:acyltransferase family protein n=1 Tax=Mucilaginibacter sp. 44-25 TaxID=1895794 RepID=UPI000B0CE555|nr:acyltransferase family protein [Mucilaginibacter sp. 44-25]